MHTAQFSIVRHPGQYTNYGWVPPTWEVLCEGETVGWASSQAEARELRDDWRDQFGSGALADDTRVVAEVFGY